MSQYVTIIVIVVLIFGGFGLYIWYSAVNQKNWLLMKARMNWGKRPEREYEYDEFEAISHYYQLKQDKEEFFIDDITWNDLDMDTIFMLLNNTNSCIGESYLYNLLRKPSFSKEELEERNRLVEYFQKHKEKREKMQVFFGKVGKTGKRSIFDYIYNLAELKPQSNLIHFLSLLLIILSVSMIPLNPAIGVVAVIGAIGYSWYIYNKLKKKIAPYIMSCSVMIQILKMAEQLGKESIPEMQQYVDKIVESRKKFGKFKRNTFFLIAGGDGAGAGGGIEKVFVDYFNFTFHLDLIQFRTVIVELKNHIKDFEVMVENIGVMESAIAIASFRTMMKEYCIPELSSSKKAFYEVTDIYHPMIAEPVKNSIHTDRGVLLTGSNASGKSTFLKTVAINTILAQSIYTCMAASYKANFYKLYSSMSLKDDLMSQESYYIVEIKSLKRIMDHMADDTPVMCFVDEVLRGTNTVERIAASSQILKSMAKSHIMSYAATHDIELTHILEKDYNNYHFQEEVFENDILFNYQLYEGRATSRNAIKLLSIIGYDDEIIKNAEGSAKRFVETGEWAL